MNGLRLPNGLTLRIISQPGLTVGFIRKGELDRLERGSRIKDVNTIKNCSNDKMDREAEGKELDKGLPTEGEFPRPLKPPRGFVDKTRGFVDKIQVFAPTIFDMAPSHKCKPRILASDKKKLQKAGREPNERQQLRPHADSERACIIGVSNSTSIPVPGGIG